MTQGNPSELGPTVERRYWLVLFNVSTWRTFNELGARVVGFRPGRWSTVCTIAPGDYLLCYVLGVSRWMGALRVQAPAYRDATPLWPSEAFSVRLPVMPVVVLPSVELGLPLAHLRPQLSVFEGRARSPQTQTAPLRRSPARWPTADGEAVLEALLDARVNPVVYPLSRRQHRAALGALSTVDADEDLPARHRPGLETSHHSEIQWLLLSLGSQMGLDVWVARNDQGRHYGRHAFAAVPNLKGQLPQPFDPETRRIVEMIDVLWLRGNAIVAAFEVESTTAVYSGLLRLADLIAVQPHLNIPLYVVAPDERRAKVMAELQRPVFRQLKPPLGTLCRYIPFSALRAKALEVAAVLPHLQPSFIDDIAEPR
ncbi:MAG: hypothetical protein ACFCBW_16695, partial [Candidatus Competibacterales bacterium]